MLVFLRGHSQMLLLLVGVVIGVLVMWKRRDRVRHNNVWQMALTGVVFTACSFGAATLFASFEMLMSGKPISFGAVSTYGIYLFAAPILLLLAKLLHLDGRAYLDLFALYAVPSLFLMRCNCLIHGCCIGKPLFQTGLRWPTREAELVYYIVVLVVLWRLAKKSEIPGQLFPLLMISYGCFRFVDEWFREGERILFAMHISHIWSVLTAVIGLSIYYEFRMRAERNAQSKTHRRVHR